MNDEWYYCPECGSHATKTCITNRPQYKICPICKINLIPSGYDDEMLIKIGNLPRNATQNLLEEVLFNTVVKDNPKFNPEKHEEYIRYSNSPETKAIARAEVEQICRELREQYQQPKVKCPRCGSTQIQMVQRKWSWLTGFFTNKVDRVCVNCKHRW